MTGPLRPVEKLRAVRDAARRARAVCGLSHPPDWLALRALAVPRREAVALAARLGVGEAEARVLLALARASPFLTPALAFLEAAGVAVDAEDLERTLYQHAADAARASAAG